MIKHITTKENLLNELTEMLNKCRINSIFHDGEIELHMNKYVFDWEDEDFSGDILAIMNPRVYMHREKYRVIPQYTKNNEYIYFEFNTIEEIAMWIEKTYF